MSAQANYFKLGIFILVGSALMVVAIVVFGMGSVFERELRIETYLDESVQGLDAGSSVKLRGVLIGNVKRIGFTHEVYQLDKPLEARRSYVKVEIELKRGLLGADTEPELRSTLEGEVEKGLRVRMASVGVTGLAYLEVDYLDPESHPPLPIDWRPNDPYLPSAQSTMNRLITAAENVFDTLGKLDLETIGGHLDELLLTAKGRLEDLDVEALNREGTALIAELRETNDVIREVIDDPAWKALPDDLSDTLASVRSKIDGLEVEGLLDRAEGTFANLDRVISVSEVDLADTLNNLRVITDHLREFTEAVKRNPSRLLFGRPARPRALGGPGSR